MDPDRARQQLVTELDDLDESMRWASREDEEQVADEAATSQHPADHGTDIANRMEQQSYVETARNQRERIAAALARLDEGSWGRCLECDRPIDDERLAARPEVTLCREHQAAAERREQLRGA